MERRKKAKKGIMDVMKMVQPQEYPNTSSSTRQTNISATNFRAEATTELQNKGTNQLIETGFTSNGGGLVTTNCFLNIGLGAAKSEFLNVCNESESFENVGQVGLPEEI